MHNHEHTCAFPANTAICHGSNFAFSGEGSGLILASQRQRTRHCERVARQTGMRAVSVVAVVQRLCTSDFSYVKSGHTGRIESAITCSSYGTSGVLV